MTINAPTPPLPSQPATAGSLARDYAGSQDKALQLGQVLFGKVLRVYQDNSYLVDLNGKQHVVDSAIPLRQDEVFRGKIVGLGERVVLEKMIVPEGKTAPLIDSKSPLDELKTNLAGDQKAFINQHQKIFNASEWKAIVKAANHANNPILVLAAAVYLQKIGMPFDVALSVRFSEYLSSDAQIRPLLSHDALYLTTDISAQKSSANNSAAASFIADYLGKKTEESLDSARALLQQFKSRELLPRESALTIHDKQEEATDQNFNQAMLYWLMNTQVGGAISHRLVVLPLVVDGNLIELEMALFDQNESAKTNTALTHKVIYLSLEMGQLGKVNATVHATNKNLRIHFSSTSEPGLHLLATHNNYLAAQLEQLGCQLDEFTYTVTSADPEQLQVTRPIIDLIVNADSLSMLV